MDAPLLSRVVENRFLSLFLDKVFRRTCLLMEKTKKKKLMATEKSSLEENSKPFGMHITGIVSCANREATSVDSMENRSTFVPE